MTATGAGAGPPARDLSSLSNPDEARVTHLSWDAVVDFEREQFFAQATYDVTLLPAGAGDGPARSLYLDTSGLDVRAVHVNGAPATFSLSVPDPSKPHLGSRLAVSLGASPGAVAAGATAASVRIQYVTSRTASAAQWLPPAQTAGKRHPYVFTQCQAIHARSLLPCQDCPAVKMTYDARVTVPGWATCVMSALSADDAGGPAEEAPGGGRVFHFSQPVPVPSYLFALTAGELESRDVSPRCRVWAEPETVEAVAFEFSECEAFLEAAEDLTGLAYAWSRYDLLCLPPSFPYGGMENPCLTFVTPTLLAGDKSLADVVAHEAAHSWSGNLVTNATWEHFWLNEGWTMFLERKIMVRVRGDDRLFDFDAIAGWEHLKADVDLMPDKYTKLIPDLGDNDPDDAFSGVPYEKGFNLIYALEKMVGAEAFAEFTKVYFERFKFATVTSQSFRDLFETHFHDNSSIKDFDWDTWLHKPGLPPLPAFDRTLSAECEGLAAAWTDIDDGEAGAGAPPPRDIAAWSTGQKTCFLDALLARDRPLSRATIARMKDLYRMHESHNSEVLFRFCMLAVAAGDEAILPVVVRFITSQGRMKFVRPLYRSLFRSDMGKEIAVKTFLANKDFYHPIAAKMVAADLSSATSEETKPELKETATSACGIASYLKNPIVIGGALAVSAAISIVLLRGKRH